MLAEACKRIQAKIQVLTNTGSMRIIEKMRDAMHDQMVFYSFEFFPPKTAAGVDNL